MNCKKAILELTGYFDGALDVGMQQELELHLSRCRDCRVVVDTTRKTIQLFCGSEPVPLPEGVRERLHTVLHERFKQYSRVN